MSQAICDFFGCLRLPFDKAVPLRDLFPSTAHQEVQARLTFAAHNRFPALITGRACPERSEGSAPASPPPCAPSSSPWTPTCT